MLHEPGVMSATRNSDLLGPEARFPYAHLYSTHLVSSAFHLLDLTEATPRKGSWGTDSPPSPASVVQPQQGQNQLWGWCCVPRRCCRIVSFLEDRVGFKFLLLCLRKSKSLAGITGVVLHLSSERRLREEKWDVKFVLFMHHSRLISEGFEQRDETVSLGAST